MLRVFIGHDVREASAYHVCQESIISTASRPEELCFTPVTGERRDGSNDFIYARFLPPYWCGYKGMAIFMDGDMIVRGDIFELERLALSNSGVGVSVVKRPDYQTKFPTKYLGNKNENYPRKNWSSVMVWNCEFSANKVLTPTFIAASSGAFLHRFKWLQDTEIGDLPRAWNRLVLEETVRDEDQLLHYTIGTPCFPEYATLEHSDEWHAMRRRMNAPELTDVSDR